MSAAEQTDLPADGPWFDDLTVGLVVDSAPGLTLTPGHAATHQAIVGDRLALALDGELAAAVVGSPSPLAHPALVWDVAIGQSTLLTRRVIANLFYRGLAFHRAPVIGDTLRTCTEVVALRRNRPRPDRPPTGMAVLRVRTVDQRQRPVLDFHRCAMLPLSAPDAATGADDDLDAVAAGLDRDAPDRLVAGWDLSRVAGKPNRPAEGAILVGAGGDVVSSAPELTRLTLNVASAHHDATASGRRLVYGGHTIGIAAAQASRALPQLVTIAAWHACDHTGPVHEGDTLFSTTEVHTVRPLPGAGALADLRTRVRALAADGGEPREVLDWRYVGVLA